MSKSPDPVLGIKSCVFLDKETRRCSVYEHRPNVCRRFPGGESCKWEDRRIAESEAAGRPVVILTQMPGL